MPKSMTGYGQAENDADQATRLKIEMRSVNHRYLDISIRLPRELQSLEDKVRRALQRALSRGRVEVFVTWRTEGGEHIAVALDRHLVQAYNKALTEISELCSLKQQPDLHLLGRLPDVLRVEKEQLDMAQAWEMLAPVIDIALNRLVEQRESEGGRLTADIASRLDLVDGLAKEVLSRAPAVLEDHRHKLEERIKDSLETAQLDQSRLLTEIALFADRSNVTEELVRLQSHLTAFRDTLTSEEAIGRKLDFLTQELFREINTIGSKANDYETARLVVEMKSELEKIREQVQNIE